MIVTVQRGVAGIEIAMQRVQQIARPDPLLSYPDMGQPKVNNSNDFKMQTQLKQKLKSKTSKSVEVAAS
ncbi:hypothetical protein ACLKA7_009863 [Drosophila subpalustris]